MKRKLLQLTAIVGLMVMSLCLISCASFSTHSRTAKTTEVFGATVVHNPLIADLNVAETKVTGEANVSISGQTPTKGELDSVKQFAAAVALSKVGGDVLVEPRYETIISRDATSPNSTVKVIATGYPGTYKNFRHIKDEDFERLQKTINLRLIQTAEVFEGTEIGEAKRSPSKLPYILGGIGLLGLILIF